MYLLLEHLSQTTFFAGALVLLVLQGTLPVLAGLFQFGLVAFSLFHTHAEKTRPYSPRISVLIPAWNEDAVIGTTKMTRPGSPLKRVRSTPAM